MGWVKFYRFQMTDEQVARLTRPEREDRVLRLIERAHDILEEGQRRYGAGRQLTSISVLYSGGNDSTTIAHMFRGVATHAIHANTGIGIEQTREFVRRVCAEWSLPLIEKHPPVSYDAFVLEHGFPGPGLHYRMYQRLKERCLDAARYDLGVANKRKVYGVYVAGRRRAESERRSMPGQVPLFERDGSVVWVSPIAEWTKLDLVTYRLMMRDVPRNETSDLIHMSGECLCGAFAKKGELAEIASWSQFAPAVAHIRRLEAAIADRDDIPAERKRWGWGADREWKPRGRAKVGRLCSSCTPGQLELMAVPA
jgi:3'-phosphoadenosine 5'-phosphosulfate sulfotransferase (PAPS reductase)/FAD synthetase